MVRTFGMIASAVMLASMIACGQAESHPQPRTQSPADAPVGQAITGMYSFAEAFGDATVTGGKNSLYSPMSLAHAFAMLRAGARGETARQLDEVFGFPDDGLHEAFTKLSRGIVTTGEAPPQTESGATREMDAPPADPVVAIANGLFVQQGFTVGKDFARTLDEQYGAKAEEVDFTTGRAKEIIDDWVAGHTADRIRELFAEIDPNTVAVLANAIYLKAEWKHQFEPANTRGENFRLTNGSTTEVAMMNIARELDYAKGKGWQAVALPYAGDDLTMWVLVPDESEAGPPRLSAATLSALDDGRPTLVTLALPRWDFGTKIDLLPVLDKLGLTTLDELSGIAPGVAINDAIHRANITVDEAGTEAAAVTGIGVATSAGPEPQVNIRADHPFSFAITHRPTGAPLFLGTVADPTQP